MQLNFILHQFTSLNRIYVLVKLWDFLSPYFLLKCKGIFFCVRVEGREESPHGCPH